MHQDRVILGVGDGVKHLLWRQAHVDRVQRGPQHGDGKKAFQIAVAVVIHHGHNRTFAQPQPRQCGPQPMHPRAELGIGQINPARIGDPLRRIGPQTGFQQFANHQRIIHRVPRIFAHLSRAMPNVHMTKTDPWGRFQAGFGLPPW